MTNIFDTTLQAEIAPGYSVSKVIKGNWQLSTGHRLQEEADLQQRIADTLAYIRGGITTLDFGDIYLGVEEMIGKTLAELSGDERSHVQLHTKYVPDISRLHNHSFKDAEAIINRSCKRLGVDEIDLVQFHWWDYETPGYIQAMQDIRTLQEAHKVRFIGVTNFDTERMKEFVDAGITPASIQLQYSLLDRRPEKQMIDFCEEHGVHMLCYGTVAGGFLSEKYLGLSEPCPPFENRSLVKYKLIIDEFGGWDLFQTLLRTLKHIADEHNVSIATIASAYVLTRPMVAAVIVGSRDASHLLENQRIANITLSVEELRAIEIVLSQAGTLPGDVYNLERYDAKHANIMHKANNAE